MVASSTASSEASGQSFSSTPPAKVKFPLASARVRALVSAAAMLVVTLLISLTVALMSARSSESECDTSRKSIA